MYIPRARATVVSAAVVVTGIATKEDEKDVIYTQFKHNLNYGKQETQEWGGNEKCQNTISLLSTVTTIIIFKFLCQPSGL